MTATELAYPDGPEVWRAAGGVEWSYWDLWYAVLCVRDHDGDWDGLDAVITQIGWSDGEAKWSHLLDLRERLAAAGLSAGELVADAIGTTGLITRARAKVLKRDAAERCTSPAIRRRCDWRAARGAAGGRGSRAPRSSPMTGWSPSFASTATAVREGLRMTFRGTVGRKSRNFRSVDGTPTTPDGP